MKPATIILGAALILVTGASSAIILKQQAEIEALKARQATAAAERPAPRVESAPETRAEPEIVTVPARPVSGPMVPPSNVEVSQQRPGPGGRANRFAEMLADPAVALLMRDQQKADLDGRYAALFKKLGLSGPEIETLKDLLAEKQLARMEARAVARAEGLTGNDRDAMRELVSESDDEIEARIIGLLGDDRYAALKKYEGTTQQRARVAQLDQRLSYSQSPLQPFQNEAMVEILASTQEPRPNGRRETPEEAAAYLSELKAYDTAVYTRAQSVLNTAQLEALRQMQKQRQDRVRLEELMRRGRDGGS